MPGPWHAGTKASAPAEPEHVQPRAEWPAQLPRPGRLPARPAAGAAVPAGPRRPAGGRGGDSKLTLAQPLEEGAAAPVRSTEPAACKSECASDSTHAAHACTCTSCAQMDGLLPFSPSTAARAQRSAHPPCLLGSPPRAVERLRLPLGGCQHVVDGHRIALAGLQLRRQRARLVLRPGKCRLQRGLLAAQRLRLLGETQEGRGVARVRADRVCMARGRLAVRVPSTAGSVHAPQCAQRLSGPRASNSDRGARIPLTLRPTCAVADAARSAASSSALRLWLWASRSRASAASRFAASSCLRSWRG